MSSPGAGQIIAGKYELEVLLGRGGMGSVWAAEHRDLGSRVAVKFMSNELVGDQQARARFEREARAAAQISSPHIVHVYDHGLHDGTPFIVMELLEGEDLGSRIQQRGPIPLPEAKRIVHQIAKGLERAHEHGFVHRDLKPANVFLCTRDDDMVKILDFGVARPVQPAGGGEVTTSGMLLGSPQYMSPEQARGMRIDSRSDVWALGVLAYRAITGERPFLGTEIGDIIVRISVDPHTPATQNMPTLPEEVNAFFDKALAKRKEDRFQTATDLAAAFRDIPVSNMLAATPRRRRQSTMKTLRRGDNPARDVSSGSIAGAVTTSSAIPSRRSQAAVFGIAGLALVGAGIAFAVVMAADDVESAPSPAARESVAEPTPTPPERETSTPTPSVTATASASAEPVPVTSKPALAPRPVVPRVPRPAPPAPDDRSIFKKRR